MVSSGTPSGKGYSPVTTHQRDDRPVTGKQVDDRLSYRILG